MVGPVEVGGTSFFGLLGQSLTDGFGENGLDEVVVGFTKVVREEERIASEDLI